MGTINVRQMKVMSFLKPTLWHERFIPGSVSLVVQSGMLSAGFLTSILLRRPFGLSKISSIGNKMDVDEIDVLKYLINDPETKTIAMYLESINNGREFYQLAHSTKKPIIVLKSGRTAPGTRAASSHTAALSQNDRILDGAFRQAGIIRVRGMTELIEVARSFGVSDHQVIKRPKVAILTFSGGAGVVSSDDIDDLGMELAPLQPQTLTRLKEVFPDWMAPANPVDLYPAIEKNGPEKAWNSAIEAAITDPQVDGIIAHMFALPGLQGIWDIQLAGNLLKKHKKQLVVWVMGSREQGDAVIENLSAHGIPAVTDLDSAARLLRALTMHK
jgi:acetyltransferase